MRGPKAAFCLARGRYFDIHQVGRLSSTVPDLVQNQPADTFHTAAKPVQVKEEFGAGRSS